MSVMTESQLEQTALDRFSWKTHHLFARILGEHRTLTLALSHPASLKTVPGQGGRGDLVWCSVGQCDGELNEWLCWTEK